MKQAQEDDPPGIEIPPPTAHKVDAVRSTSRGVRWSKLQEGLAHFLKPGTVQLGKQLKVQTRAASMQLETLWPLRSGERAAWAFVCLLLVCNVLEIDMGTLGLHSPSMKMRRAQCS